jgi:hypothetical protein
MTTSIIIVWIHYIFHSQNEINICVDFLVSFYEVTLNVYVCFMYFSYKYRLILPMEMHLNLHEYSPTLISCKLHLHIYLSFKCFLPRKGKLTSWYISIFLSKKNFMVYYLTIHLLNNNLFFT